MGKMFKLIKNEIIKLLKRKSLLVMLLVIAFVAVGAAVLFNYNREIDETSSDEYLVGKWKKEIEDLERFFAPDHYLDNAYADNSTRGKQYRNRSEMLQFLVDNHYSPYDWRYTSGLIQAMFDHKLQMDMNYNYEHHKSEYDRLKALADSDDWKTYYRELAENAEENYLYLHPIAEAEVKDAAWFEYEYRTQNDFRPGEEPWRDQLIESVVSSKISLAYFAQEEYERTHLEYTPPLGRDPAMEKPDLTLKQVAENRKSVADKLAVATYRLEHNVKTDVGSVFGEVPVLSGGKVSPFWECFATSSEFILAIGVLVIIVAGQIVASEFSSGTIKFLLVNPVKRWKIVIAKYVTVILLSVVFTLLLYIASALASLAFFGADALGDVIVRVENGVAWGISPYLAILGNYGWAFVEVLVIATMAFAISSLLRSTAISIGVGLFVYLSGTAIVEVLATFGIDFGRYLLFANMDLPAIVKNVAVFPNQTLPEAIILLTGHMVVFLLTAWDGFVRREI
ncbi:MAG: ABC transporter permease [Clostridia bacterium]|nr:ABC transporter permease [Clostridia bacterium]